MSTSLVLGFFDGVHKAHKAVITSALEFSDNVVLITFKESPAVYFGKKEEYILSRKDSLEKIKKLGVKNIVELDFSEIANKSAEEYLKYLINTYNPVSISTGFNHTFGLNKSGNAEFLMNSQSKYNFKYICVQPVKDGNDIISSSLIRNYLKEGKVDKANSLLESKFILEGKVVHGAKIGRTIGFPTANINYPKGIVKLPFGVYCVSLSLLEREGVRGQLKSAIMNWGMKPTVHNTLEPVIEVHILDFDGDLYGENIRIEVLNQIRGEKKFGSLDELKVQIKKDIKKCSEL